LLIGGKSNSWLGKKEGGELSQHKNIQSFLLSQRREENFRKKHLLRKGGEEKSSPSISK